MNHFRGSRMAAESPGRLFVKGIGTGLQRREGKGSGEKWPIKGERQLVLPAPGAARTRNWADLLRQHLVS